MARSQKSKPTDQTEERLPQDEPVPVPDTTQDQSNRPPSPPTSRTPADLQRLARERQGDDVLNVQLLIDGSDADGVRCFNEALPTDLVRAILDPEVADFFIPIRGTERMKSPRVKSHWLHTSYIREIFLLDELPEQRG